MPWLLANVCTIDHSFCTFLRHNIKVPSSVQAVKTVPVIFQVTRHTACGAVKTTTFSLSTLPSGNLFSLCTYIPIYVKILHYYTYIHTHIY